MDLSLQTTIKNKQKIGLAAGGTSIPLVQL
jgi:hypothetical protein